MAKNNKKLDVVEIAAMRGFSNYLDELFGWKDGYKDESSIRGFIHGVWHTGAGVCRFVSSGNAGDEFIRAGQQFDRLTTSSSHSGWN